MYRHHFARETLITSVDYLSQLRSLSLPPLFLRFISKRLKLLIRVDRLGGRRHNFRLRCRQPGVERGGAVIFVYEPLRRARSSGGNSIKRIFHGTGSSAAEKLLLHVSRTLPRRMLSAYRPTPAFVPRSFPSKRNVWVVKFPFSAFGPCVRRRDRPGTEGAGKRAGGTTDV